MSNMRITKLIFIQTGGQNKQYLRPFTAHVDQTIQNNFNEIINSNGPGGVVSPNLASLAFDIIHPHSAHQGEVNIPNGWESQRMRFFMEIENVTDYAGSRRTQILTGFTDRFEVSHTGYIDPETRLYFNNVVSILESDIWTPNGQAVTRRIDGAQHVLHSPGVPTFRGPAAVTLRPADIFSVIGTGALGMEGSQLIDCSAMLPNGMQIANRKDEYSPTYLERAYRSYNTANLEHDNPTHADLFLKAKGYSRGTTMAFDNFIRRLKMCSSMNANDWFTYGELCGEFPGLDNIVNVVRIGNELKTVSQYNPFSTNSWTGANYETIDANYLIHAVPSLMMDLMLSEIHFATTNDTIAGIKSTIQTFNGFSNKMDMRPYVNAFLTRFEHEYMPSLTRNNQRCVKLIIHANLMGESYINIQYDNNHPYEFVAPSFCDGFFSPLITKNQMDLQSMASTFETLLSNTSTNYLQPANQQPAIQTPFNFSAPVNVSNSSI